jgi:quercetin dioxygenase-like cupin family protein
MPSRLKQACALSTMMAMVVGAAVPAALAQSAAHPTPHPAPAEYQNLLTTIYEGNTTIIGQELTAYPTGRPHLTAAIVTIPPGGETGWHLHEVPLFAYVLSGTLSVDYGTLGIKLYRAGEALLEGMNWPHKGTNNGTEPVEILAVYLGAEGLPNATAVDGPR